MESHPRLALIVCARALLWPTRGRINPPGCGPKRSTGHLAPWQSPRQPGARGGEMGRFLMKSTGTSHAHVRPNKPPPGVDPKKGFGALWYASSWQSRTDFEGFPPAPCRIVSLPHPPAGLASSLALYYYNSNNPGLIMRAYRIGVLAHVYYATAMRRMRMAAEPLRAYYASSISNYARQSEQIREELGKLLH